MDKETILMVGGWLLFVGAVMVIMTMIHCANPLYSCPTSCPTPEKCKPEYIPIILENCSLADQQLRNFIGECNNAGGYAKFTYEESGCYCDGGCNLQYTMPSLEADGNQCVSSGSTWSQFDNEISCKKQ